MQKVKREITLKPIGYSAQGVTGSCNLLSFNGTNVLIECGGVQEGHTILANYNMNKTILKAIKAKEINYIFIGHNHYDHIGMIPALFHNGCTATIIATSESAQILREMWLDSCKIMQRDCDSLNRKSNKNYDPFYNEYDVDVALNHIQEHPFNKMIKLQDDFSFRFIPSGHIMLAAQVELYVDFNNHTKKILVTSDLGNTITEESRIFVEKFKKVSKANIVIGESTYGLKSKRNTKKDFAKDLEKIKSVITQFCIDNHNRVLIPCFSLDRTPTMLWYLYEMFKDDEKFTAKVIVDSPLAIRLLEKYSLILNKFAEENPEDTRYNDFCKMMNWKNLILIREYTDSADAIKDLSPKVILSSGGMLQSGRSVMWAQSVIPKSKDCIIFCGYCGVDTFGYRLKHAEKQKTITINNKVVANRCQVVELFSFSSHMQHAELVNYYKGIVADKIYLLHGDEKARLELKEDLQEELSKMCKSTKIGIINKSTVIKI